MTETVEQIIWLLRVYFWSLRELISVIFDAVGIETDTTLVAAVIVAVYAVSLIMILRLIFGHLGSIIRLVGLALYVLVLTVAYNRLLYGG